MLMLIFITVVLSLFINDVHYILQIAPILPEIPMYDNYCFDLFCIDEYGNWQWNVKYVYLSDVLQQFRFIYL